MAEVVTLRLFGPAREAAGIGALETSCESVGDLVAWATERFGADFANVLARSRVWVNGEASESSRRLADGDEVAILPPVSGG